MKTVLIESKGTSFEKDERLEDGIGVVRALGVRHFVIRTSIRGALDVFRAQKDLVLLNAGDGAGEHPTQALLDAATLCRDLKIKSPASLKRKKLGILGDIRRSRVARSWVELAMRLGVEVSLIAPEAWQPTDFKSYGRAVTDKSKVLGELDYLMCLRVQKERMSTDDHGQVADFVKRFKVSEADLKGTHFKILHPGPVNWGVELEASLKGHERSLIDEQLKMSPFLRRQLLLALSGR
jgi:aspartate carbamoyltransferase catalytic subunit